MMKPFSIPLFREAGRAYAAIVLMPVALSLVISLSLSLYHYGSSIDRLAEFRQTRLQDMLSHLAAELDAGESSEQIAARMEAYSKASSQADAFRRHIVLVEGTTIVAGTDGSVIGTTYRPESRVFQGFSQKGHEASVSASLPLGTDRTLVAHEYITEQVSAERTKALILALFCLFGAGMLALLQHLIFRLKVTRSIAAVSKQVSEFPADPSLKVDNPRVASEFYPIFEAWEQTTRRIGPGIQEFVHAERKSAIILLTNAFRHCLSRISDLMSPAAQLPTKALSASEITMLHDAQNLLRKLYERLDDIDVNADPLNLCQRILNSETAEEESRSQQKGNSHTDRILPEGGGRWN